MPEPILQLSGISKRFPGVVALEQVSLEIYQSEVVALIGENGAGKSTLMKILGGVIQRDAGAIRLDGAEIEIHSPREASSRRIEFIHQELSVLDNLDVAANIFLRREPTRAGWLKLINHRRLYSEADAILEKLGLDISSRTPLARLSLAQQQLVEIARAISAGARILIMDEPTSSLTLTETRRLLDIVRDLKAHEVSSIYISHRLHEVEEIADRVVVLRDGRNVGALPRGEISHDRIVRMMVGRDLKDFFKSGNGNRSESLDREWLSVRNLRTLRYPNTAVSFTVGRGEVLGFAGLVGAGRSEVARAIFGIDATTEARVSLGGQNLQISAARDAIRQGIYLVPEDRRVCGAIVCFNVSGNNSLPRVERYFTAGFIMSVEGNEGAPQACESINIKTPSLEMKAAN